MLKTGDRLSGRYVIERPLGQGGMAAVHLARMEALGNKPVAIKEMFPQENSSPEQNKRAAAQFRQEASFLANLDHPNLVAVTDYFQESGRSYLVMSYVKGRTLSEELHDRQGPFPVPQVLEWAKQLTAVLGYLHSQNPPILFRDLKPSNIMLDESGTIRLIDFGIARAFDPGTETATFLQGIGSAGYSPIEQYQGAGSTDPRSDIYSLGATLYHLLTNTLPKSPVELISQGTQLAAPTALNPAISPGLETCILKMMGLRKEQRQLTMSEVQKDLEQAEKSSGGLEDATENLGASGGLNPVSLPPPPQTMAHPAVAGAMTDRFDVPASTKPMASEAPQVPGALLWVLALASTVMLTIGLMNHDSPKAASAEPEPTPMARQVEVVEPPEQKVLQITPKPPRHDTKLGTAVAPPAPVKPVPSATARVSRPQPKASPPKVVEPRPTRTVRSASTYPKARYPKAKKRIVPDAPPAPPPLPPRPTLPTPEPVKTVIMKETVVREGPPPGFPPHMKHPPGRLPPGGPPGGPPGPGGNPLGY